MAAALARGKQYSRKLRRDILTRYIDDEYHDLLQELEVLEQHNFGADLGLPTRMYISSI